MSTVLFYIALPFLYLLSLLPLRVLYLLSDLLYLLLYRVVGYRKSVVMNNLQNAFPDWSPEEIEALCSKY